MKTNKISFLIIASIFALLALSTIQGYLVMNSYQLKKDAFILETDKALEGFELLTVIDSISDIWNEDLKNSINDYKSERISKAEAFESFFSKVNRLNSVHKIFYDRYLKQLNLGYHVDYQKRISEIIIFDGKKADTIFPINNSNSKTLFGVNFDIKNGYQVNKSTWVTQNEYIHEKDGEVITDVYDLHVRTLNYIQIKDWKTIVLNRMMLLLIASFSIFLFVIGLLFYSIKKLISQKKIGDIKTDFINNITHELKTPLATLSIATKSLQNESIKKVPEAFDNTVNIIERQNNRLQKLIDQVMTNSLSSSQLVLRKEKVVDNQYFNNLIEDFKLSVHLKNVVLESEISSKDVLLRLDTFHFSTAILNVLDNAVKYGVDKTKIVLKTELKNNNYIISVLDNGIGIPEKNQQQIFDKFYRVSVGDVHDVKGLGLGLYYTNQIIKAHNGSISIKSTLNKGTTFTIKIPVN